MGCAAVRNFFWLPGSVQQLASNLEMQRLTLLLASRVLFFECRWALVFPTVAPSMQKTGAKGLSIMTLRCRAVSSLCCL